MFKIVPQRIELCQTKPCRYISNLQILLCSGFSVPSNDTTIHTSPIDRNYCSSTRLSGDKYRANSQIRTDNLSLKAIALPLSYAGICADTSLHTLCTRPHNAYSITSARHHRNGRIRTPDSSQTSECSSLRASLRHRLSRSSLRKGYGLNFTYWIGFDLHKT